MNRNSFALRRGALITLILVLATALAACSGNSEESQPADGDGGDNGTATVADGAVEITAEGLAFDATTIEAAAGEDFTITLVNNDSAPHNISIYTEEGGESLVTGATAEAGQTVTIDVSALDPGEYYFQCDIHPDMNGSVVVSG
jgi:plastocyanin